MAENPYKSPEAEGRAIGALRTRRPISWVRVAIIVALAGPPIVIGALICIAKLTAYLDSIGY